MRDLWMTFKWPEVNRANIPEALRAELEEYGAAVVAQILGRPYTHAHGQTAGVPVWTKSDAERKPVLEWLREQHNRDELHRSISATMELAILIFVGFEVILNIVTLFRGRP